MALFLGGIIAIPIISAMAVPPLHASEAPAEGSWNLGKVRLAGAEWVSPPLEAAGPFNAVVAEWRGEGGVLWVSASPGGAGWTEWEPVLAMAEDEGKAPRDTASGLAMVPPGSRYLRVKASGSSGTVLDSLKVHWFDTSAGPKVGRWSFPTDAFRLGVLGSDGLGNLRAGGTAAAGWPPAIISRAQWGADEGLRFKDGKEIWPREYRTLEKVIVHHTVTSSGGNDPAAVVRAIYRYHAQVLGWGDTGYNYLVDWRGNIYEGRFGGDRVVGGHAYGYNHGSLGVAVIGDYSSQRITKEAMTALTGLLAWKARYIDPLGNGYFVDKVVNNIAGHRECNPTACPGDALFAQLPALRQAVSSAMGYRPKPAPQILDLQVASRTVLVNQPVSFTATVRNLGTGVAATQGPPIGFAYTQGSTYSSTGYGAIPGKWRVGADYSGDTTGPYPFRWGMGSAINPGETAVVSGSVVFTQPQRLELWFGLTEEGGALVQDKVWPTDVLVIDPPFPRLPPPATPDPNRTYFPETGHYLAYGFRNYWQANGGLFVFGYPITEEFLEISPTDGKAYTVQYFERARFEYHPEHRGTPYEVLLGLLGTQVTRGHNHPAFNPVPPVESTQDRLYFPETGHTLSYGFKQYWERYGGLPVFGYPISEEFTEVNPIDGKAYTVQYFERARFEYHPEYRGTPYEVLLGLLGTQVLKARGWLP